MTIKIFTEKHTRQKCIPKINNKFGRFKSINFGMYTKSDVP